ncbi:hypothetical protein LPJ66_007727 [Kickxella alabastrina]|uniref:Uncharacterized protein n=1 Tax=Kickxella alabastrina TaxID=61397 RepID=A0ACC1I844_9FUNG|nr:hypothetical protein LPJ66_007727 [Kickxella alabastrina]
MARRSKGASARRRAARIARNNAPGSNTPKENLRIEASTTETIAAAKHSRAGAGAQQNPADSARASQEIIPGVPEDATGDSARHANHPERVTFFTSPFKVSYYSTLYLKQKLRSTAGYIVQYPLALAYSVALGIVYTLLHFVSGPHIDAFRRVDAWVGWYSYWVLLGVLSSIGLGAGLHTFVLFLGPHIARVTLTAYECTHTSFAVRGPNAFLCSAAFGATQATFAGIMRKVILESLCWGAGTAIGELPPYFIARAASATGQGDVEYQRLRRKAAAGGSLSVKDRALLSIYHLLQRFGFAGILVFAAIPNPLFDLAGITCGHFKVPFWTFFGATFIGKSIIKSSMQTAVVITAFSKEMVAVVLSFLAHVSPWVHDLAEHVLRKQAATFGQGSARGGGGSTTGGGAGQLPSTDDAHLESSSFSLLGSMWNACISIMLIYFVISTLETFAQSYVTDVKSWGQHQLARVGSRPRMDTATATTDDGADALGSDDSDCSSCSSDSGSALR